MARITRSFSCLRFQIQASLLLSSLVHASAASIIDNGKFVTLGDIDYYASGSSVSRIVSVGFNLNYSNADILPITIVRTDEAVLTDDILRDVISNYSASDDVFQPEFLNSKS